MQFSSKNKLITQLKQNDESFMSQGEGRIVERRNLHIKDFAQRYNWYRNKGLWLQYAELNVFYPKNLCSQ